MSPSPTDPPPPDAAAYSEGHTQNGVVMPTVLPTVGRRTPTMIPGLGLLRPTVGNIAGRPASPVPY